MINELLIIGIAAIGCFIFIIRETNELRDKLNHKWIGY
jgi:hypothetical protein